MKNLKVLLVLGLLLTGIVTSCTNQELNEDNEIVTQTDKPKVRRPGNGN